MDAQAISIATRSAATSSIAKKREKTEQRKELTQHTESKVIMSDSQSAA